MVIKNASRLDGGNSHRPIEIVREILAMCCEWMGELDAAEAFRAGRLDEEFVMAGAKRLYASPRDWIV